MIDVPPLVSDDPYTLEEAEEELGPLPYPPELDKSNRYAHYSLLKTVKLTKTAGKNALKKIEGKQEKFSL